MADIAGFASITVDGQAFLVAGSGNYQCSGDAREALNGQDGYHGTSRKPVPGKISWQGRDNGAVSISVLNNAVDATVVLQLANGKIVIARNATRTGEPITVNSEDATFEVEFTSPDVRDN